MQQRKRQKLLRRQRLLNNQAGHLTIMAAAFMAAAFLVFGAVPYSNKCLQYPTLHATISKL
jgi:hypothetical protein